MGRRVRARLSLVLTPHPLGPLSNPRILATLMKTFNDRKVIRSCDLIFQKNNLKLVSNDFVHGKIGCILSSPHVICKAVFKTYKLRCVNKQNTSESLLFDSFSIFILLVSEGHKLRGNYVNAENVCYWPAYIGPYSVIKTVEFSDYTQNNGHSFFLNLTNLGGCE